MNLNDRKYGVFKVSDIFTVKYGINLELIACTECKKTHPESVNFVSRTAENNGVSASVVRIDDIEPQKSGLISVAGGGSVLSAFLQDEPFYSGRDLYTLDAKENISNWSKLFIITIIEQNKYKYSYGRQANKTLPSLILRLPIDDEGNPDYQFMENYIKSLHYMPLTTNNKSVKGAELQVSKWKEFRVGDFFDIHPTKAIEGVSSGNCGDSGVPLVVNSAENNGVAGLINMPPTEQGGIITFSDTTDGNTFFYQPNPFIGFAHVQGMYPKTRKWSASELLFIVTMLMFDANGRYNYGRKMRRDIISEVKLKLPTDADGEPDWKFMEDYIKLLPYGDRL